MLILSVEALQSPTLLGRHLKLMDPPQERVFAKRNFIVFRNVFTRFPSTALSLNSFLTLDTVSEVKNRYFSGRLESTVFKIFRDNGYRIVSGYANSYLGTRGPYVDDFFPRYGNVFNSSACRFTEQYLIKLFGVCEVARLVETVHGPGQPWRNRYLDIISMLPSNTPVLTFHHLLEPGHTGHLVGAYDHTNETHRQVFASRYRERLKLAAETLDATTELLLRRGRPFILLVFGDHGIWISRSRPANFDDPFIVRDRYGSSAALLAHGVSFHGCDITAYSPNFTTPARILSGVLSCLSNGTLPTPKFKEPVDFARFVYE
jgi:hypothetical protein